MKSLIINVNPNDCYRVTGRERYQMSLMPTMSQPVERIAPGTAAPRTEASIINFFIAPFDAEE